MLAIQNEIENENIQSLQSMEPICDQRLRMVEDQQLTTFYAFSVISSHINTIYQYHLDPVGSTVRYEMMKLCTGSV